MSDKVIGIIGIIGGMGPMATVEIMKRIIERTPALDDQEHIHVIADNNPKVPSRIAALIDQTGEDPTPVLIQMASRLEQAGADTLIIPCNTAHHYLPVIAEAVNVPILSMVDLAVDALRRSDRPVSRIGMLASPAVRLVGLYEARLRKFGLEPVFLEGDDEQALLRLIQEVKAGRVDDHANASYRVSCRKLQELGAQSLLVACTELSLLQIPDNLFQGGMDLPVVDALDQLVDRAIEVARPV